MEVNGAGVEIEKPAKLIWGVFGVTDESVTDPILCIQNVLKNYITYIILMACLLVSTSQIGFCGAAMCF